MGKKVLMLLTNCFDPDPRVLSEALTLTEHGYQVTIIGWDRDRKKPPIESYRGIRVERVYVRSTHGRGTSQILFLFVFWILALIRILNRDFDIVHCHDLDTLPLGLTVGKLRRKRIIFDAHESFADMLGSNVLGGLKRILRSVESFLVRRTDALLTVGELLRSEYQGRGAKHTYVVGNWEKLADYTVSTELIRKVREELNVPAGKMVITYIAWLSEERMLPALLDTVWQDEELFLIIGGDGPLREAVQSRSGENRNIRYLGYVDPGRIPLYTAMADVIYYGFDPGNPNSRFSAPNKLFEALAAGKAVVTGTFGEIGRIVEAEQCGLTLSSLTPESLREAFRRLRRGGTLERFQENARRAGRERYNWGKAAQELLRAYRRFEPAR